MLAGDGPVNSDGISTSSRQVLNALAGMFLLVGPGAVLGDGPAGNDEIQRSVRIEYQSPLLASRGDARITHREFDAWMQSVARDDRPGFVSDPERIAKTLSNLLETQAIANDAIERGALDDPIVQAELYRVVAVRLADIQRTHVMENAELEDYTRQARERYLLNKEQYTAEPAVSFTHLMVEHSEHDDAESRARELLERVRNGESLEALALEHSDDPSVERNRGRLDDTPLARLDSKFRTGIEAIDTGDVGILESGYGWHVVRVHDREQGGQQSFEDVAAKLKRQAREAHLTRVWENYLREIHDPEMEIAPGGVAAILDRYRAPDAERSDIEQREAEQAP